MYDYEYEDDILLFLRLMKFLHTEHPFVLEQIIKDYPTADEEDIWMPHTHPAAFVSCRSASPASDTGNAAGVYGA